MTFFLTMTNTIPSQSTIIPPELSCIFPRYYNPLTISIAVKVTGQFYFDGHPADELRIPN
jgi:hypothetical protein